MSIIIFIIILGLLVLIHEAGHFFAAKKNGVRVEEFGFGFPPKVFGFRKGETLYTINLLPLGGFVKLYGEEYGEVESGKVDKAHTYVYKKPWQKISIVVAGVVMNILLGAGIFYYILGTHNFISEPLPLFNSYHFRFGTQQQQVIAAGVLDKSPAQKAGVGGQQTIVTVKDDLSPAWIDINSTKQLIDFINMNSGKPVQIKLKHVISGEEKVVTVIPRFDSKLKRAVIGISLVDTVILKYQTPVDKAFSGFFHAYNVSAYNLNTIGYLIGTSLKQKSAAPVTNVVSGPIGIYNIVSLTVKGSKNQLILNLLNLTASLSLAIATINILPVPPLDGGRLPFILYEWLAKKRANASVEKYINIAGIGFFLLLAIFVSINDFLKLFHP